MARTPGIISVRIYRLCVRKLGRSQGSELKKKQDFAFCDCPVLCAVPDTRKIFARGGYFNWLGGRWPQH